MSILTDEQVAYLRATYKETSPPPAKVVKEEYAFSEIDILPDIPGVYCLWWSIDGTEYLYIGEAQSIMKRIKTHTSQVGLRLLVRLGYEPTIYLLECGDELRDIAFRKRREDAWLQQHALDEKDSMTPKGQLLNGGGFVEVR